MEKMWLKYYSQWRSCCLSLTLMGIVTLKVSGTILKAFHNKFRAVIIFAHALLASLKALVYVTTKG
jgi:hypothetical protein